MQVRSRYDEILRRGGELLYNPQGDTMIEPDAVLLALGQRRQLDQLERLAGGPGEAAPT